MRLYNIAFFLLVILLSCGNADTSADVKKYPTLDVSKADSTHRYTNIITGTTTPVQLIGFAHTLIGIPYKYGSIDPAQGFDCSGFITHVFNHFGILVPRTSTDFTYVGREVDLKHAKPGDLILFTGTDSTIRKVGHMGIIINLPKDGLQFIHSTSGKAYGVTETPLNAYYMGRYMKTIRVFSRNDL
jgi:lipoprotein Spr